jgi:hypothetical protein
MAIDLEAIRRKVAELNGTAKKTSNIQLWKPTVGEYRVRCLPWKNSPEGQPFMERWFYYIGTNPGILAPNQFGKPDPINDLMRKLYSTGKPADKEQAKKLQAKMRCYTPVIIRGEEDKGVQVWAFGKLVYQRLLSFFIDSEIGDILSPTEGFDLVVKITQSPGKQFMDTTVDAARRPSKLSDNVDQSQKWVDNIPNIDDMYRLKSTEEISAILTSWINGDSPPEVVSPGAGTSKGSAKTDALDDLVAEVKPAAVPATKAKKEDGKTKKSLDEAFEDLMS